MIKSGKGNFLLFSGVAQDASAPHLNLALEPRHPSVDLHLDPHLELKLEAEAEANLPRK